MSQISSEAGQIQRQLYLLGYSLPLPTDGAPLVAMLLKDMQAALDRVKELEDANVKLEREDRTSRAAGAKSKAEQHALRTENNSLRAEVLNYTRELDRIDRDAREKEYAQSKRLDDLRMANLQAKAELAETQRRLGECQKRAEELVSAKDPRGRIARIAMSSALSGASSARHQRGSPDRPPQAIVDLVDLSSRRIGALEKEIEYLETKLQSTAGELRSAQMEVKERDLELLRVNAEYEKRGPDAALLGQGSLNDQVDYLHERVEALERENREVRAQSAKERDDLHRRWINTENERVRLATEAEAAAASHTQAPAPAPAPAKEAAPAPSASPSPSKSAEMDRLRTECANIKSLYSQTRDQLQELLRQARKPSPTQNGSGDLVSQLRKLDASLKQAVDEVSEWRAKADDQEHRISDLTRQTNEYRLQHDQSSAELRACRLTLDGYANDLETLRGAQTNSQREADRLGDELAQAVRLRQAVELSKDDYKRQLTRALGESEGHRSLVAHLQAERDALRVQVNAQFHLSQRLEQRLAALEKLPSADYRRTL
ncbi:hypothetical protein GGH99_005424 [Coemansia sp. RSA 1285]|nr:hypothetical protein GGH99_005424 [Coemansia sp. RSA 1285]